MRIWDSARRVFFLTVMAGLAPLAQAAEGEYFRALVRAAREAHDAGKNEEALQKLDQVLAINPEYWQAYLLRARARRETGDLKAALGDLDKGLELQPRWSDAKTLRARYRMEAGDYEGALADVADTGGTEGREARGKALIAFGRYAEALKDFEYLMSGQFGPYLNARYPRAICLMALDQFEDAAGWFQADAADYGNTEARCQQILCVLLLGKFDEADRLTSEWAQAAAKPEPEHEFDRTTWKLLRENIDDSTYLRGVTRFARQEFTDTATVLEKVSDKSDQHAYALLLRHLALLRAKKADERLKAAEEFKDVWAEKLRQFLLGQLSEKQLFAAAADEKNIVQRKSQETEACFYVGQKRLAENPDDLAAGLLFEKAAGLRQVEISEYTLARLALTPPKR